MKFKKKILASQDLMLDLGHFQLLPTSQVHTEQLSTALSICDQQQLAKT